LWAENDGSANIQRKVADKFPAAGNLARHFKRDSRLGAADFSAHPHELLSLISIPGLLEPAASLFAYVPSTTIRLEWRPDE
jgi:hypothetical protein